MNLYPNMEARMSVQERRSIVLEASIEQLSQQINASFKQLSEHLGRIEDHLHAQDKRMEMIEARLGKIESTMATKEDLTVVEGSIRGAMAAMEGRMLDAFKQLLAMVEKRENTDG